MLAEGVDKFDGLRAQEADEAAGYPVADGLLFLRRCRKAAHAMFSAAPNVVGGIAGASARVGERPRVETCAR